VSDEWVYTDDDGNKLHVAPCHDDDLNTGHVHVDMTGSGPVCVLPGDWPLILRKVYEKAGLPVPVILEQSGYDTSVATRIGAFTLWPEGGKVRVNMAFGGVTLDRSEARHLAAAIVAYGDAAESKLDPAEVRELTQLLFDQMHVAAAAPADAARAILRAGWTREGGHV
jgi:hypothetical protein